MRQEDFNRRFLQLLFLFAVGVCVYHYVKSQLARRRRDDMPWFAAALAIALRWSPGASRAADSRFNSFLDDLNGHSVESLGRQDRGRCRAGRGATTASGGARSERSNVGRGRRAVGGLSETKPNGKAPTHTSGHSTTSAGLTSSSVASVSSGGTPPAQAGALDFLEGLSSSSEQSDLDSVGSVASRGGDACDQQSGEAGGTASSSATPSSSQVRVLHDLRPGALPSSGGDGSSEALAALSEELLGISVWDIISKRNRMRVSGLLHTNSDGSCQALGFTVHRLNQHTLQILYFGVAAAARRDGIGRTLVRTVRDVARREPLCLSIVVLLSAYEEGSALTDMASPAVTAFLRATGFRRTEMKGLEDGQVCFKIEVRKLGKKQKRQLEQSGSRFSGGGTTLEWSDVLAESKRTVAAARAAKAVAAMQLPPPVSREPPVLDQNEEDLVEPQPLELQHCHEQQLVATASKDAAERRFDEIGEDVAPLSVDQWTAEQEEQEVLELGRPQGIAAPALLPPLPEPSQGENGEDDSEDEWEDDDESSSAQMGSTRAAKPMQIPEHNLEARVEQQHLKAQGSQGQSRWGRGTRWAPVLPQPPGLPEILPEVPMPQVAKPEELVPQEVETLEAVRVESDQSQELVEASKQVGESDVAAMPDLLSEEAQVQDTPVPTARRRPVAMRRPAEAARIAWRPTLRHMQQAESTRPEGR